MKHKTVIAAFVLGAAAGSAGTLWWPRAVAEDTGGSRQGETARQSVDAPAAGKGGAAPGSPAEIFSSGPLADPACWEEVSKGGAARAAALRRKAGEILGLPHLSQRRRLLSALLETYQPGDWRGLLDGLVDREKIGGRFDQEYELLMERAAEVDGAVILDRILKESGGQGLPKHDWQKRCMANWATAEGARAVEWWNTLPDGEFRDFLSAPLIEGLARKDIDKAWEAAQVFEPGERGGFAGNLVRAFAADMGVDAAARWIEGLGEGDGTFQALALGELSQFMHQIDFPTQGSLVGRFAAEPWAAQSTAFHETARVWGQVDSPAAMEWAASLPEGHARSMAMREAMHQWALRDAQASGAWLSDHPDHPESDSLRWKHTETLRARGLPGE